jgi:hypothetical protein
MTMRYIASLRHFLATGRLGPLSAGMTLAQVAQALGAPQAFGALGVEDLLPLRWCYASDGSHLEIDFQPASPHRIDRFRVEPSLWGDFCLFGPDLLMTTDGITAGSTPSVFLKSGALDEGTPIVELSEPLDVTIVGEHISLHFGGAEDYAEALDPAAKDAILASFGRGLDFREIDALLVLVDICSHAGTQRAGRDNGETRASCSMKDYLAMVRTAEGPA